MHFTLTVVTSADGFIARYPGEPPQAWASPEEQVLFFRDVEAADWAVMGRGTHEAANRPERRRIVFSRSASGWRRPTQLWLDPDGLTPADLAARVDRVHTLANGLILGGTTVHDWFARHDAMDRVHLTVEPVTFGSGLPIFTDQMARDPFAAFAAQGYAPVSEEVLNAGGTRFLVLSRAKSGRAAPEPSAAAERSA
ncbi:MAG: dihydrofolate reductase family protein [Pseudomonadota bacterium]